MIKLANQSAECLTQQVHISSGKDDGGIWFRIVKYEPDLPLPFRAPSELAKVRRFVLNSKLGWREYFAGQTFNLHEEVFHLPILDSVNLAHEILDEHVPTMAETMDC